MGRIVIPVMDEEPFPILSAIRSMLSKYGFTEKKTESSEKILLDFYEEERKFDEFSQKALRIRNNECDKVEFEEFTNSIACHLPTRSLYPCSSFLRIIWRFLKMHVIFQFQGLEKLV